MQRCILSNVWAYLVLADFVESIFIGSKIITDKDKRKLSPASVTSHQWHHQTMISIAVSGLLCTGPPVLFPSIWSGLVYMICFTSYMQKIPNTSIQNSMLLKLNMRLQFKWFVKIDIAHSIDYWDISIVFSPLWYMAIKKK